MALRAISLGVYDPFTACSVPDRVADSILRLKAMMERDSIAYSLEPQVLVQPETHMIGFASGCEWECHITCGRSPFFPEVICSH